MEQLATPGSDRPQPGHAASWPRATSRSGRSGPSPVEGAARAGRGLRAHRRRAPCGRGSTRRRAGLTRFVGRDAELEQLRRALERAQAGPRPGRRRRRRARRRQVPPLLGVHPLPSRPTAGSSWRAGSVSYGKATAYLPVIDLLKAYFQIERARRAANDPREGDRQAPGARPGAGAAAAGACSRCSTSRSRMPRGRRSIPRSAGSARSTRSSGCCSGRARSSRSCWSSRTCTGSTPRPRPCSTAWSRACRPPASCCSSTTAPSTGTGWGSKTYYSQLRIDPLPAESADELLGALLGDDPSLEPAQALLIERTEGNPLLPRGERADARRDAGRSSASGAPTGCARPIHGDPGPGDRAGDPRGAHRPAAARGQAPAPDGRRSSARTCPSRSCTPSRSCPRTSCAGLAHLQAAEFLYEARLFPDLEYTFKHALTHEVAYGRPAPGAAPRASRPASSRRSSASIPTG